LGERLKHPTIEQDAHLLRVEVKPSTGSERAVKLAPEFENGVFEAGKTHDDLRSCSRGFQVASLARPSFASFPLSRL
jgi:hypothetical protein